MHPEQVADELMEELDRGASGIHIKGMYTGEERMMVFCVCLLYTSRCV